MFAWPALSHLPINRCSTLHCFGKMIIIANSESTILVPSSKLLCVCLSSWHFPSPRNFLFFRLHFLLLRRKENSFSKCFPHFFSQIFFNLAKIYIFLLQIYSSFSFFSSFFSFKDNCLSQKIQNPRKKRQNSHSLLGPVRRRFWSHFLFFSIERARWNEIDLKIHSEFVACCCVKKVYKHPMSFTQKIASSRQMRREGDKT